MLIYPSSQTKQVHKGKKSSSVLQTLWKSTLSSKYKKLQSERTTITMLTGLFEGYVRGYGASDLKEQEAEWEVGEKVPSLGGGYRWCLGAHSSEAAGCCSGGEDQTTNCVEGTA